jgi:hypothetical protein
VADTSYIVLRRYDARDIERQPSGAVLWQVVDSAVHATSADQAIRKTAREDGVYVATPGRSFKPVNVKSEQTTVLRLAAEEGT